jgi:hypothetical protein
VTRRPVVRDRGLPSSGSLGVDRLAGAFRHATQAYKFLFFRALLEHVAECDDPSVPYAFLLERMLEGAWWPVMRYRLQVANAAANDRLSHLLDQIGRDEEGTVTEDLLRKRIRLNIEDELRRGMLRYVPQRFLRPWLDELATSTGEARFDHAARRHASGTAEAGGIPYTIESGHIRIDARWHAYFTANLPIVVGWADAQWLAWVQARNPNVPVTMDKLRPPRARRSLAPQTAFLAHVSGLDRCFYTGAVLREDDLAIDHFVPWAYVAHDRIWNLVPSSREANLRKGARLPDPGLVQRLADLHHDAIVAACAGGAPGAARFAAEYLGDLRLDAASVGDRGAVRAAFGGVVGPMLSLAARMGFASARQEGVSPGDPSTRAGDGSSLQAP